jgi:hypothetical protein
VAAAGDNRVAVPDAAESWYASTPLLGCTSPIGCPPIAPPPTTSYPAHTLHVGVTDGQETARTYVEPDFSALPAGANLLSGTVVLPVSTDPNAGTSSPDTAQMEACLVTKPITDGVSGSTSQPPATDCKTHAPAKYDAKRLLVTVNLAPFLAAWAAGTPHYGIDLQPAPNQALSASWQVAFNGRQLPRVRHIRTVFTLSVLPVTSTPTAVAAPPASAPPAPAPVPAAAPPPVSGPAPSAGPVTAPSPAPTGNAPVVAGNTTAAAPRPAGFQYPAVMLLPLAFLAGLVFVARVFTSDATPRRRLRW